MSFDSVNAKPKIVVVGAGGRLGAALAREYASRDETIGFTHAQLDLGQPEALRRTLAPLAFDVLINAAALTNVDYCESHREEAMRLNAEAPRVLAEICGEKEARFVHVSTDYVFDGEKRAPYTETDPADPISVYGESKRAGEEQVLAANERALVIRVSWVFGPDRPSFVDAILKKARDRGAGRGRRRQIFHADLHARHRHLAAAAARFGGGRRDCSSGESGSVQLAGVRAVGARLLPRVRRPAAGENGCRGRR